jgi:hypothetical protein
MYFIQSPFIFIFVKRLFLIAKPPISVFYTPTNYHIKFYTCGFVTQKAHYVETDYTFLDLNKY